MCIFLRAQSSASRASEASLPLPAVRPRHPVPAAAAAAAGLRDANCVPIVPRALRTGASQRRAAAVPPPCLHRCRFRGASRLPCSASPHEVLP
jgi:hypothetical protein